MSETISIVIPVFNGEDFLPGAIENALQQDFGAVEVIVVNDGSQDRTEQVAKDFAERIVYLSQSNRGPSAARNLGLTRATGDFIAFLDCDDRWPRNNLSVLREALRSDADIVLGRVQEQRLDPERQVWVDLGPAIFWMSLAAMLTRRSTFHQVGALDETILIGEDMDWFFRAREKNMTIVCLEHHLAQFHRQHDANITRNMEPPSKILLDLMRRSLKRRGGNRCQSP